MLRHLVHHGEVIRLTNAGTQERLVFRHDRVRDALFADAMGAMIRKDGLDESLLAEPYFAEVIGAAVIQDGVSPNSVERLRVANPLALFHALRLFHNPTTDVHRAVLESIDRWLRDPETHTAKNSHLRWAALAALSQTESPVVVDFVKRFKEQPGTAWQARFRNGDLSGGLELCRNVEPGVGAPWRDRQIEHAKLRYGHSLTGALGKLLRQSDLEWGARCGALRLAGYTADPGLGEAIEQCWLSDTERGNHLRDYLWAAAQCCGKDPDRFLGPVCDAWAALSDKPKDEQSSSPRSDLAAHDVRWAFRRQVPFAAICYFIKRAQAEDLRWPLTFMMHGLDHPDAVEFVAMELAAIQRKLEGSERFSPLVLSAGDEWRRQQESTGRPMSVESRQRLLSYWLNSENDKHIRRQAFRLWSATSNEGDLDILRQIPSTDEMTETILWERVRRQDRDVLPTFLEKLRGSEREKWWSLAPFVDPVTDLIPVLDEEFSRRDTMVSREEKSNFATDYHTAEVLMQLPPEHAENLLLKHWNHLQFRDYFVQAALFAATPPLLELAAATIKASPAPQELLKYLTIHYGIRVFGRLGITREAQVQALVPYLDYFDEMAIHSLWEVCNERAWFALRRKHFDSRAKDSYDGEYIDKERAFVALDKMLERRIRWADHWIDHFLKTGAPVDEIMALLGEWVSRQRSVEALQLVATAVIHAGQRRHLAMLNAHDFGSTDRAAEIRIDTIFAVKRRTLC